MHLRIILVDDHEIVRLGLRTLLSCYPHFEVVADARDAEEAMEMTLRYQPDIVVMDIRLPGKNGIEATRDILAERPESRSSCSPRMPTTRRSLKLSPPAPAVTCSSRSAATTWCGHRNGGSGRLDARPGADIEGVPARARPARKAEDEHFVRADHQELSILAFITEGRTNREIAERVFLSARRQCATTSARSSPN